MWRVADYPRLSQLPPEAVALLESAGQRSLFYSRPWFELFEATIPGRRDDIRYFCASAGERCAALLPLWEPATPRRFWQPRHARSLSNFYSTFYSPLLGEDAEAGLAACARELYRQRRWDVIDLLPLAEDETGLASLEQAFVSAGYSVQRYYCFGNWYEPTRDLSWAQYLEARPSQLRETLRRRARKLARERDFRYQLVTGGAELEAAIGDYLQVYAKSWKKPEPYPEFMPALFRLAATEGWLRLGLLYVDGTPAAAQCWLVHAGSAAIYKLAYDPAYKDYSVGSLLTAHLMQHVLEVDRVSEVDYLTGDDAYKRDWMSQRRICYGLQLVHRRTWSGRAMLLRNALARWLKRWRARPAPGET